MNTTLNPNVEKPLPGFDSELFELIQNGILQETPSVSFKSVAGLEEPKQLLQEAIVWPMERPEIFKAIFLFIPCSNLKFSRELGTHGEVSVCLDLQEQEKQCLPRLLLGFYWLLMIPVYAKFKISEI